MFKNRFEEAAVFSFDTFFIVVFTSMLASDVHKGNSRLLSFSSLKMYPHNNNIRLANAKAFLQVFINKGKNRRGVL